MDASNKIPRSLRRGELDDGKPGRGICPPLHRPNHKVHALLHSEAVDHLHQLPWGPLRLYVNKHHNGILIQAPEDRCDSLLRPAPRHPCATSVRALCVAANTLFCCQRQGARDRRRVPACRCKPLFCETCDLL
eukprot:CAMPEP_0115446284 /NCGR_PEP_ID=MMETSP0271-20121206/39368_1 /TAXON_ID=71861 /ORGANISM="Scrippsiella trochoidea, Strain CCMP3099" /LENGTH=132 /DNA_ID=CAMNT_0002872313 /DNA_START=845 /DNA_END=1243 /DNA_ORIENTATION=-